MTLRSVISIRYGYLNGSTDRDHHERVVPSVLRYIKEHVFHESQIELTHANSGSVRQSMGAQIGPLLFATSGVQLAVGFFGTFISLRVPL
jgi:hypothetical protein